ncbi:hypothetical protein TNCV_2875811 [Trichonephila clavipes]|nr:hypothetical protein TNCV_2875811 [Trichonephila clavipes]
MDRTVQIDCGREKEMSCSGSRAIVAKIREEGSIGIWEIMEMKASKRDHVLQKVVNSSSLDVVQWRTQISLSGMKGSGIGNLWHAVKSSEALLPRFTNLRIFEWKEVDKFVMNLT